MSKYLVLVLLLSGCSTVMPRFGHSLLGAKEFYLAMCQPPPPSGKEKICLDGAKALNEIIDVYSEVNGD